MIELVKTVDNRWGVSAPQLGVVSEPGSFEHAAEVMQALGVESKELGVGLADLEQTGNNCAHFGINRTFIFSKQVTVLERPQNARPLYAIA